MVKQKKLKKRLKIYWKLQNFMSFVAKSHPTDHIYILDARESSQKSLMGPDRYVSDRKTNIQKYLSNLK